MLVYYFVPFIVSNRYLLFWVSNGHNSVTVQNRTHVYMNFIHHKDQGNHLRQLCPKVVEHPVYPWKIYALLNIWYSEWNNLEFSTIHFTVINFKYHSIRVYIIYPVFRLLIHTEVVFICVSKISKYEYTA